MDITIAPHAMEEGGGPADPSAEPAEGGAEETSPEEAEEARRDAEQRTAEEQQREAVCAASGLFRAMSDACLRAACRRMEARDFQAGDLISALAPGCFCLLRTGSAQQKVGALDPSAVEAGCCLGEAALLGFDGVTPASRVEALTDCSAWVLSHFDFMEVLAAHLEDKRSFGRVDREAVRPNLPPPPKAASFAFEREVPFDPIGRLREVLQTSELFRDIDSHLVRSLPPLMEDFFVGPGESILKRGAEPGESAIYLILGGRVHVEGESEVLVHTAVAKEVVGLCHALDIKEAGAVSVRAWGRAPVWCARLSRASLHKVFDRKPEERKKLKDQAAAYAADLNEEAQRRHRWLTSIAVPALAATPLLEGCPEEFLCAVAAHQDCTEFEAGTVITSAGDFASSMMVVLDGCVDLESRNGTRVGRLTPGGVLGEPEVLGLFDTRMVTARAMSDGQIMEIPGEALRRALNQQGEEAMKEGFACLLESRRAQVARGLPLSALKIKLPSDDSAVSAVGLQAERMHLEPGDFWNFLPDQDPCGARIAIFVSGKASLEMIADGREVMSVMPGTFLCEGDAAMFGARLRVLSSGFEAYRIRTSDLLAAAFATPKPPDWYYHFRLKERDARGKVRSRLMNANALQNIKGQHPCDVDINEWKNRRLDSMKRADQMRQEKADMIGAAPPGLQLPLLAPTEFGTTAARCWQPGPRKVSQGRKVVLPSLAPGIPEGLRAYPCTRGVRRPMPRISSEPILRKESNSRGSRRDSAARQLDLVAWQS